MDKMLFTVKDVMKLYSISKTGLYQQVREGKIRLTKRGRNSLFTRADLEAWVESLRQSSGEANNG